MTLAEIANELADFRHYPPGRSDRETGCFVCGVAVRAGQGVCALGGRDGNNYAATLHRACAADVEREQERQRAQRRR